MLWDREGVDGCSRPMELSHAGARQQKHTPCTWQAEHQAVSLRLVESKLVIQTVEKKKNSSLRLTQLYLQLM